MKIDIDERLCTALNREDAFDQVLALQGEVFREHKNRRTFRVLIGDVWCFVKIHGPTPWRELLKNLLRGRMPVLTALPEIYAIERLEALGVPTIKSLGHGVRGRAPAWLTSFIITESLQDYVHLDDMFQRWTELPRDQFGRLKRQAIAEVGSIARLLHESGLNHRDFYLCHFMLPDRDWEQMSNVERLGLRVIDLHRMQSRRRTPRRWIVKDLSGLLFSALDVPLTRTDVLRFCRVYWGEEWKTRFRADALLRRFLIIKAKRLFESQHGREPLSANVLSR